MFIFGAFNPANFTGGSIIDWTPTIYGTSGEASGSNAYRRLLQSEFYGAQAELRRNSDDESLMLILLSS